MNIHSNNNNNALCVMRITVPVNVQHHLRR